MKPLYIKIKANDNIAIAIKKIKESTEIIRYGVVLGYAKDLIPKVS